jgi:hypothetical protein
MFRDIRNQCSHLQKPKYVWYTANGLGKNSNQFLQSLRMRTKKSSCG